jgi:hypothetical protein
LILSTLAKEVVMADPDSDVNSLLVALRNCSGSVAWILISRRGGYR